MPTVYQLFKLPRLLWRHRRWLIAAGLVIPILAPLITGTLDAFIANAAGLCLAAIAFLRSLSGR